MSGLRVALAKINTVVGGLGGNSAKIMDNIDTDKDKNLPEDEANIQKEELNVKNKNHQLDIL